MNLVIFQLFALSWFLSKRPQSAESAQSLDHKKINYAEDSVRNVIFITVVHICQSICRKFQEIYGSLDRRIAMSVPSQINCLFGAFKKGSRVEKGREPWSEFGATMPSKVRFPRKWK
jgi:hypothetical protein